MKKLFVLTSTAFSLLLLTSCGAGANGSFEVGTDPKGIGRFKKIELTSSLDEKMISAGETVYNIKCASCHKLNGEKLTGPGWQGVTIRRTPEWIMNFITNTDEMLDKDTAAQNMLGDCGVRMPNPSLSDDDARATLEFMRRNDSK